MIQNQFFQAELAKLNPKQREAVEQIEGPVLVVAGPGTGKTHILASRIGNILLKTDAQAHNILCLTFTDAGVQAMRERLLSMIGAEAHKVHIFTFHAFCAHVIRSNPDHFGFQEVEPIDDLDRIELIRKLIDALPTEHILRKANKIYQYEQQLAWLFKAMKAENWQPETIKESIDTYLKSLPTREDFIYKKNTKEFNKGDIRVNDIAERTQKMDLLSAAADLFEPYQLAMRKRSQFDFEDMIAWTISAFEQNEFLLRRYQEQYLYFLVDEYQDTNGSQDSILRQLYSFWGENANIFIVGDDDQAIYEFQGAKLEYLMDFYKQHQANISLVVLEENYRSSQAILDAADVLISENIERLVNRFEDQKINKKLTARNPLLAKSPRLPIIAEYENELHEVTDIVNQIQALQANGVALSDIAILYAKHSEAETMTKLLQKRGVAYNTKRKIDVLTQPIVKQLLTMLRYIDAETNAPFSGEKDLFQLLHFPYFNIPVADIAALSMYIINENILAQQAKNDDDQDDELVLLRWRNLMADNNILRKAKVKSLAAFVNIVSFLDDLLQAVHILPLSQVIERIVNRSGLLAYVMQQSDKIWLMELLQTFTSFVQRQVMQYPDTSLPLLLEKLKNMKENSLRLALQKQIEIGNGLTLSTTHGAKGLEYEYVFMINATKASWEDSRPNARGQFSLPDTLTFSKNNDGTETEARRRLFFVGMTRAKSFLQISYTTQNTQDKPQTESLFVSHLLENAQVNLEKKEISISELAIAQAELLTEREVDYEQNGQDVLIKKRISDMVLSITALNRYWDCPLSFYLIDVLQMPNNQSVASSYGLAVHNALYQLFRQMLREKKVFPPVSFLTEIFKKEMKKRQARFDKISYAQYVDKGVGMLKTYYAHSEKIWPTAVELEVYFDKINIEDVPVKGTIDKIELVDSNSVRIVDYKTGVFDAKKIKNRNSISHENGSPYWNQVLFYKLLYEQARPMQALAKKASLEWVEADTKGKIQTRAIEFSDDDVAWMKTRIATTYNKIQQHDFYKGCGKKECQWCNFINDFKTPIHFDVSVSEWLDDGK